MVPSRIELESRASETLILSIVLQDLTKRQRPFGEGKITELFQQSPQVGAKYLYGYGQQDDAKELADGDHAGLSE